MTSPVSRSSPVDHVFLTPSSLCDTLTKPINAGEKKSFIVSFVISSLLTFNPVIGLLGGLTSTLASRIDSVVSPILKKHLETTLDDVLGAASPFAKFALKLVVVMTVVNVALLVLAPFIGVAIEINILVATIISIAINLPRLLSAEPKVLDTLPEGRPYFVLFA